jgi:DNA-binding MarR family transcriptional regulator
MSAPTSDGGMPLEAFLPYRLAVLAEVVSRSMAQIYGERFDLTRDEWRVLAALSGGTPTRTTPVIDRTTLDKVSVSRALQRMLSKGLVERTPDPDDGRGHVIRLLPAGRALFRKIVPMVQAREQYLLSALDDSEQAAMDTILDKLTQRARQLTKQG